MGDDRDTIRTKLLSQLRDDKPVRVPTSPMVRVGVEKELCPNLVKLGDKVSFANDFTLYLTYKHRKSSIAGGDVEDMDFDEETQTQGFYQCIVMLISVFPHLLLRLVLQLIVTGILVFVISLERHLFTVKK